MVLPAREHLIQTVQQGELTPEEAELQARDQGFGPLSGSPDSSLFNPMTERWWSLAMTTAWIVWRSVERTRDYWDVYRSQCWVWRPTIWQLGVLSPGVDAHELTIKTPATKALLQRDSKIAPTPYAHSQSEDAEAWLLHALRENWLQANGIRLSTGQRVIILPEEWTVLEWRDDTIEPSTVLRRDSPGHGYAGVSLLCSAVVGLWPSVDFIPNELPRAPLPMGPGHLPLHLAVQWIATKGGQHSVALSSSSVWQEAYSQVLDHIASKGVSVIGTQGMEPQAIDSNVFVGIAVDYRFGNEPAALAQTENIYLRTYPYIDDAHWRNGFDDSLCDWSGVKWSRLMVPKADVGGIWPFDLDSAGDRTGAAGRPSPMHLVVNRFHERFDRGEALDTLAAESKALAAWLKQAHPNLRPLTPKTIKNNLAAEYRRRFSIVLK